MLRITVSEKYLDNIIVYLKGYYISKGVQIKKIDSFFLCPPSFNTVYILVNYDHAYTADRDDLIFLDVVNSVSLMSTLVQLPGSISADKLYPFFITHTLWLYTFSYLGNLIVDFDINTAVLLSHGNAERVIIKDVHTLMKALSSCSLLARLCIA